MKESCETLSCIFCRELRDPSSAKGFLPPGWPFEDRLLARKGSLAAIPGYGPQVYPYILVMSDRHILSAAELRRSERQDLFGMLTLLTRVLGTDGFTVFEHAGCRNIQSCIEHFHLHVIPRRFDLRSYLSGHDKRILRLSPSEPLDIDGAYLLTGEWIPGQEEILASVAPRTEKKDQFFRQALANEMEEEFWDWRRGMNMRWMWRLTMEFKSAGAPRTP